MRRHACALMILVACGSPEPPGDGSCGPNGECPDGFTCEPVSRRCVKNVVSSIDAAVALPDAAAGCTTGSGPTMHANSVNGETWSAAASPHVVTVDLSINGTLTLEPCAVVQVAPLRTITVNGAIVADGTAARPITIQPRLSGQPFATLRAYGTLHLVHVTIEGGGDPLNTVADLAGMLDVAGIDNAAATQERVFVDHVTLSGSASNGIVLRDGAGFAAGSTALTITGSARYPMNIWSRAAGTVPDGSYGGNGRDEILLPAIAGHEAIQESLTLHARGVPYHVGGDSSSGTLTIASTNQPRPILTIEPGVTLRFRKGGVLLVDPAAGTTAARAGLVAAGTEAAPIVFTSAAAAPAAGDWLGIYYGMVPVAENRLDHARVEYAGGTSASGGDACAGPTGAFNDAAIRIFGPPATQFVTHTTILASAGHGIDRGWRADTKLDFLPGNDFQQIAWCKQSYPKDANGGCPPPASVPCP